VQLPVVIWLHATGGSAELMTPRLLAYAGMGFLAVALDARYHGRRAAPDSTPRIGYQKAIFRAWQSGAERPFLLDNVRDLQRVLDYLETRPDVDSARIGMAGISLGGMHTWLTAALDARVAAAAPLIGVQSFEWALKHNHFHGRVCSLQQAFELIAKALAKVCARLQGLCRAVLWPCLTSNSSLRCCLLQAVGLHVFAMHERRLGVNLHQTADVSPTH
jgi:dienelactone hydrolase